MCVDSRQKEIAHSDNGLLNQWYTGFFLLRDSGVCEEATECQQANLFLMYGTD